MENQQPTPTPPPTGQRYGKRPLWQWIVIYLVVGGVLYGAIYYFAYARNGGSTNNGNTTTQGLY